MTSDAPRHAVVTGAGSGIGAAIATRLTGKGWKVTGVDKSLSQAASCESFEIADLTQVNEIRALCAKVGKVDAIVHAAGFMITGVLEELDPDDGDRMYAVHVRALAVLAQTLSPVMRQGSRIVAIGSRTSRGAKGKAQYAATKSALTGLVRSLAIELAPRGITANVVSPAATATPILSQSSRSGIPPVMPPIGRFIEPNEVAAAVAFLLGPDAGAITGQDLLICGGASL